MTSPARVRSPLRTRWWCRPAQARSDGIGAILASTPRSERMIRSAAGLDRLGRVSEQVFQRPLHAGRPLGGGEEHRHGDRLEPAPAVELLELGQFVVVEDRRVQRDLATALGRRHQQVALAPGAGQDRGHQLLADCVERRVGHLREQLLEVAEQRLGAVGEHGQRGVGPHRADRLLALVAHRAEDVLQVLERVAECLLPLEQRLVVGAGDEGAWGTSASGTMYSRSHLP